MRHSEDVKILIISSVASEEIGTIQEHVAALMQISAYVRRVDYSIAPFIDLELFDVVILHYSIVLARGNYISARLARRLRNYEGLTIHFIQDEYRWIDETAMAFRDLKVDVVFSLIDPSVVRKVYHHHWCDEIRFEHTLTGFVNDELIERQVPNFRDRKIDVGYRARKLLAWYGFHAMQKWEIAERFEQDCVGSGLALDISTREEERIYGDKWVEFLENCKAVLGTESGASVCDFTGEIQRKVEEFILINPDATYPQLREIFFKDSDGEILMNVISPRCFEAAALRTLMIMYPGEYGGILKPWQHYVPLERDHSNISEIFEILRDENRATEIINRAYGEIACSGRWSLRSLQQHAEQVIVNELHKRSKGPFSERGGWLTRLTLSWDAKVDLVVRVAKFRSRTRIATFYGKPAGSILHFSILHFFERATVIVFDSVSAVLLPNSVAKNLRARLKRWYLVQKQRIIHLLGIN